MRVVVQRVSQASVTVENAVVSAIDQGFLILLGVTHKDGIDEANYLARKVAGLRLFEDAADKLNLSLADVGGEVLVVSQFTLYGDVRKGRRPSFVAAARPEQAVQLYEHFCDLLTAQGLSVQRGVFQAHMQVALINDGPVTLWLDTETLMNPA
ncbi:MAG: D-aminoacyl-tRNA deacylase [Caldilineaceae bacterium]